MSALGHKRTFRSAIVMSALPPKADMCGARQAIRVRILAIGIPKTTMKKIKISQAKCSATPCFTSHKHAHHSTYNRGREPAYTSLRLVRVIPTHASGCICWGYATVISALPPKADIRSAKADVRFVRHATDLGALACSVDFSITRRRKRAAPTGSCRSGRDRSLVGTCGVSR